MIDTLTLDACDQHQDPIAQLRCRSSRLAGAIRQVQRRLARVEWQQRFLLAGSAASIATGAITVLRFVHDVGAF